MKAPLLSVRDLAVTFRVRPGGSPPWVAPRELQAVRGVAFDLAPPRPPESSARADPGKSTLARSLIGTVTATGGQALWRGRDLFTLKAGRAPEDRSLHSDDLQNPLGALNPRMTAGRIIAEPLLAHEWHLSRQEITSRVSELLERVGLLPEHINRYPHEFSGGQCQRIGIARALIVQPRLLICDEPVSALDVSVQAQIVNLLRDLQRDLDLSMIFISHDLSVVKHIADRILVFYLGRVMEYGAARDLVHDPRHPYTRALIAATPVPDPEVERGRPGAGLEGELPSPLTPPSGCVFRTRCPVARPSCAGSIPALARHDDGRFVACPYG